MDEQENNPFGDQAVSADGSSSSSSAQSSAQGQIRYEAKLAESADDFKPTAPHLEACNCKFSVQSEDGNVLKPTKWKAWQVQLDSGIVKWRWEMQDILNECGYNYNGGPKKS